MSYFRLQAFLRPAKARWGDTSVLFCYLARNTLLLCPAR